MNDWAVRVRIGFASKELSAEDIQGALGIPFDRIWQKGAPRGRGGSLTFQHSGGYFMEELPPGQLQAHVAIKNLLARTRPAAERIIGLPSEVVRELALVMNLSSPNRPRLHLDGDLIAEISKLRLEFDLDYRL